MTSAGNGSSAAASDRHVYHAVWGEHGSVVAAVGGANLQGDGARARDLDERVHVGRGVTDELSTARATAPRPIGATAKLGSSSGESADTKVSIAYTRRGVVPSDAAATAAPSSPISSRTLQMKINLVLERRAVQVAQREELRGRADAVVERTAGRTGAGEPDILLGHRHGGPGTHAPGYRPGARRGAPRRRAAGRSVVGEAGVARH